MDFAQLNQLIPFPGGWQRLIDNPLNQLFFWVVLGIGVAVLLIDFALFFYGILFSNPDGAKAAINILKKLRKKIRNEEIWNLSVDLSKNNLPSSALSFLTKHLYCSKQADHLVIEVINGRFAARSAPSQFISLPLSTPFKPIPTVLTAIGILGTFIGISIALNKVDFSAINEAERMIQQCKDLLEGMKVAFATSLFGMGASIIFMAIFMVFSIFRRRSHIYYRNCWQRITTEKTAIDVLERFDPEKSLQAAQALSDVAIRLDPAIIAREMATGVSNAMRNNLEPVFKDIHEELKHLREIKADNGENTLKALINELREQAIKPMSDNLNKNTLVVTKLVQHVANLRKPMEDLTDKLGSTVEDLTKFQSDTLAKMENFASKLTENTQGFTAKIETIFSNNIAPTLDAVGKRAEALMNQAAKNLESTLSLFFEQLKENLKQFQYNTESVFSCLANDVSNGLKQQQAAFQQNTEDAIKSFTALRENFEQTLESKTNKENDLLEKFNEALNQQAAQISKIGEQAAKLMSSAHGELTSGLENIGGMLDQVRRNGQDELQRFMDAYQGCLQGFFEQQNHNLDQILGQQREGLSKVIQGLQDACDNDTKRRREMAEHVDASMKQVKEAAEEVGRLVSAVGLHSGERIQQLGIMAADVARHADSVSESYESSIAELRKQLTGVATEYTKMTQQFDTSLQKANDHLAGYMENARRSQVEYVNQAEKALDDILFRILQIAEYLVTAIENKQLHSGNNGDGIKPSTDPKASATKPIKYPKSFHPQIQSA